MAAPPHHVPCMAPAPAMACTPLPCFTPACSGTTALSLRATQRLCRNEANGTFPSWERPPTLLGCEQGSVCVAVPGRTATTCNRWAQHQPSLRMDGHREFRRHDFWVSGCRMPLDSVVSKSRYSAWLRVVAVAPTWLRPPQHYGPCHAQH